MNIKHIHPKHETPEQRQTALRDLKHCCAAAVQSLRRTEPKETA